MGKNGSFKSAVFALSLATASMSASAIVVDTETRLDPDVGAPDLAFATAVAIDSNTAAVSAHRTATGSVYIYTRTGTNWAQTQLLTTGLFPDDFGASISLFDDLLAVGQAASFSTNPASVFIYTNVAGVWSVQQKIDVLTPGFATAVDLDGTDLAVGSPFDSSVTNNAGAVYVYTRIGGTYQLQAILRANDPLDGGFLGVKVAIDGNTLLAGTAGNVTGAAYVFTRTGTNWTQQQKLSIAPLLPPATFNTSVALEGDLAAVTGEQTINGTNNGGVYVFRRTGTTWNLQQILTLPGSQTNFLFNDSVAIHNGQIAVGVPDRIENGLLSAGSVVIFQFNGTSWVATQEVPASDPEAFAFLGATIDFGDGGIIAGAPGFVEAGREGTGSAYVFSTSATNTPIAIATPNVLFPPNHKLVPVTISISNHDGFSDCKIVSVTSNEPVNGKGKKSPDWIITGDLTLLLRAERTGGNKAGRIYTITIECKDNSGSPTQTTVTVTVPHDRGK